MQVERAITVKPVVIDAKQWCEKALAALFSLWRAEEEMHHAWRTSESIRSNKDGEVKGNNQYFPTATFHSITAFGECGVWDLNVPYKKEDRLVETPDLKVSNVINFSAYDEVLGALVNQTSPGLAEGKGAWIDAIVANSSHSPKKVVGTDASGAEVQSEIPKAVSKYQPRQALVVGRFFHALRILVRRAIRERDELRDSLTKLKGKTRSHNEERIVRLEELLKKAGKGLPRATDYLCGIVRRSSVTRSSGPSEPTKEKANPQGIATASELADSPLISPFILLQVATGVKERDKILRELTQAGIIDSDTAETATSKAEIAELKAVLSQYFNREVDRLMSRRQIPLYPHYDAASLAFSIHGRLLMDAAFRTEPLFRACIQAVVADQNPDGTWPVGRSATFDDTGTSIQQPSVSVALSLAECIFSQKLLIRNQPDEIELLKIGAEALRRTGQYLIHSFNPKCGCEQTCSGWVSDRVRWPNVSEAWITAMAARFFHVLWLTDRACVRDARLSKYNVRVPKAYRQSTGSQQAATPEALDGENNNTDLIGKWWSEVVEPDSVVKPAGEIEKSILRPIQKQQEQGVYFLRPDKNGVSFIIYGPPGSGKTFFVETFADILGWPLVTLNPGHFIRRGLEFIEAVSSEIFEDLMHLEHAVIFFDECDELFRMRTGDSRPGNRNILSFATASMLPKLQDLHDARRVIFFLGTNYLANVDDAIRRSGRFDKLLLFDRPDDEARKKIIKDTYKAEQLPNSPPLSAKKLNDAVEEAKGWMVKDIKSYAKAMARQAAPQTDVSIDDYVKWLIERGDKEIEASGLTTEVKKGIRLRWGKFSKYAAAKKRRRGSKRPASKSRRSSK
ncbi:MAG: ATP-binding protein [Pyrinomonadaceae bacterium]|nr:ATP-binding protein [Pyrinomonadaceae bacterium]